MYINELDDIAKTYHNTDHGTIKMKPFEVKWSTCIDSSKEINDKHPKFNIIVRP